MQKDTVDNKDPVDNVIRVHIDKVKPNKYNPNKVPAIELKLLYLSIFTDGYTQPIVTFFEEGNYIIVDGYHRYLIMRQFQNIYDKYDGMLPVVVIQKNINERMASTIRHNRARGEHEISGMSKLVLEMISNGWDDDSVCEALGMEEDELKRLKHITGYAKLYGNTQYSKSWQNNKQFKID